MLLETVKMLKLGYKLFTFKQASISLEAGFSSFYPPDLDSIHNMDVIRLDRLWSDLLRLPSKTSNNVPTGHDANISSFDPLRQILDLFVEAIAALQNEGVILRLLWSLDRGIERGFFTPLYASLLIGCRSSFGRKIHLSHTLLIVLEVYYSIYARLYYGGKLNLIIIL